MDRLSESEQVLAVLHQINQAWLGGRAVEMSAWLDPDIVMVAPGFVGRAKGRDAFLAGFEDFLGSCKLEEFQETDHHADIVGAVAVVNFRFEMVYARAGERYRATGRDVWVFERHDARWTAVWRTMLDMQEVAV